MTVKIVLPSGSGPKVCSGTKVFTDTGQEITDISRIEMDLRPDCIIEAKISVNVLAVDNFEAHPLLSRESLVEAAERYGLDLVEKK